MYFFPFSRTINLFHRFNIHQELFLAAVYRTFLGTLISPTLKPIMFYVYCVFSFQGFFLGIIYMTAWVLSGTWLAGVLATVFVVCHR